LPLDGCLVPGGGERANQEHVGGIEGLRDAAAAARDAQDPALEATAL
jgi:hypothetical protein